jgi:hypothetical protein
MAIALHTEYPTAARRLPHMAGNRAFRLFVLLGVALVLGACSKCDVPTPWEHNNAPRTCHDGPQTQ